MGFRDAIDSLQHCVCGKEHRLKLLVEVSEEALERTPALLEAAGMPKRIHVTADKDTLAAAGDLPRLLEKAGYHLSWTVYDSMNSATVEAARALEAELGDAQGVLAVGTGSVSDVSRVACFARNLPYAIFGTAPSMDGFASNSAPMIENGYKRTHYGYQPLAVIADTRILARSPQILKAAGLGDVLGKYIAAADWQVAHLLTGEYYCPSVCRLVEQSAQEAYELCFQAREQTPRVAGAIMESLVFPGLAMEFCGTTRPASGAEHYLVPLLGGALSQGSQASPIPRAQGGSGYCHNGRHLQPAFQGGSPRFPPPSHSSGTAAVVLHNYLSGDGQRAGGRCAQTGGPSALCPVLAADPADTLPDSRRQAAGRGPSGCGRCCHAGRG